MLTIGGLNVTNCLTHSSLYIIRIRQVYIDNIYLMWKTIMIYSYIQQP